MKYTFEINGVRRTFWFNDLCGLDNSVGTMEEMLDEHKEESNYISCYRDESGYIYFDVDGQRVYGRDAEVMTPEEFLFYAYNYNLCRKENVIIEHELCLTLQKYGMDSIRVRINNNPLEYVGWVNNEKVFKHDDRWSEFGADRKYTPEWETYKFVARYNRMPSHAYKLDLVGLYNREAKSHSYYVSDIRNMWIVRPDLMQLTMGVTSEPNGLFGTRSDDKLYNR